MNKSFIGIDKKIIPPYKSTSLLLRRSFYVRDTNHVFTLQAIGLGIAIYYLNGIRIIDNVLCTVNSDYSKTLYLDKFDVTSFIKKGKNVIAVELGNGFYNESLETVWHINHAHWRGDKCLFLRLKSDNRTIVKSDEKFKTMYSPFLTYNELRGGETLDQRKFIPFHLPSFDDSKWNNAVFIDNPPQGKMLDNSCPPIKEFEHFAPVRIIKSKKGYIYDFGKNISGYVKATIAIEANREITFQYAEDIDSEGEINLHNLDCYQKGEPFQCDKCISNGDVFTFVPRFTYHGFRYVEVIDIDNPDQISIDAIFIHQDIKYRRPSYQINDMYQKIFDAGINSILSNTYYGFTDCPTREKLNWLNDLSASLPIIMKFFDVKELLRKIYRDIIDAQEESGNIPGIAPSPDWGYEYGPVCSGVCVLLPYLFFKVYKDFSLFGSNIKHIEKYYRFVKKNLNNNYFCLGDWTGSTNHDKTPIQFILQTQMFVFDKMLLEMTNKDKYIKDLDIREKKLLSYKTRCCILHC